MELLRDQPDLIVLDLALPDGLKLYQQIHNYGAYPLLLLTDHIPQPSQADGFQADKDSYLTKPFRLCELTAHITAHLPQVPKAAFYAGFQFNRSDQTVFFNEVELSFSKREFDLMEFLITHPNQVFDQKQLYEAVWNCNTKGNSTTVREHIRKIRHWAGVYQNRLGRGLQMERVTHVSLEKDPQESKGCFPGDLVVVSAGRRLYCIQQASGQLHLE